MQKKELCLQNSAAKSAQGALEYLLLIGGAILVAVIVIAIIIGISGSSEDETYLATAHAICAKYPQRECDGTFVLVKGISFMCLHLVPDQCRAIKNPIPISSCITISAAGTYYLSQNISSPAPCLNIITSNVKLYCIGKKITATSGAGTAFLINFSANNTIVNNCLIENLGTGSGLLIRSSNNTITNNSINSSSTDIIIQDGATSNSLNNNYTCLGGSTGVIAIGNSAQSPTSSGNSCTNGSCNDSSGSTNVCNPSTSGNCNFNC